MKKTARQRYPLILAAITLVIAVAIGGFHLVITRRADQAVSQVLDSIRVVNFAQIPLATQSSRQLQFFLEVENNSPETVEVSIADTQIRAEEGQALSDRLSMVNEPRATLDPGESAQFVGQITISDGTYQAFQAQQQPVSFHLSGRLEARAAVLWVSQATVTNWQIEHPVSFF